MHTHWKDMLIHSCYGRRFKEAKKIKKYKKIRIQIWTDKRMARDSRLFDYKLHFPFLQIVFLNWLKRILRHNCLSSDYEILQPICQYNKLDNVSRFTTCKKLSLEKHLQISKMISIWFVSTIFYRKFPIQWGTRGLRHWDGCEVLKYSIGFMNKRW